MADLTRNVLRSAHSKSAFRLEIHDDQGVLSSATGFFFEINEAVFLVTNWHVVSGKHFLTQQPLARTGRFPTCLVGYFAVTGEPMSDGRVVVRSVPAPIDIYGPDRAPLWLEHPTLGSRCDVIALPVQGDLSSSSVFHKAANRVEEGSVPIEPGCVVYVVGFPRSLKIGPGLPLWKSGYIASETAFDVTIDEQSLPAFFIDSQTREGMSGSPVFARYVGIWNAEEPHAPVGEPNLLNSTLGSGTQFLGCYSARLGPNEEGASLGICWREEVLREVCLGATRGKHPHVVRVETDQ